jgi:hypothetical protein
MTEFTKGQPVRIKKASNMKRLKSMLAKDDDRFVGQIGVVVGKIAAKNMHKKPLVKVLLESGQKVGFFDWELEPIN